MILDDKLTEAYIAFNALQHKGGSEIDAFKEVVRSLLVEKVECATTQIGGTRVEFPLPDIENDIPMPEVKPPKKTLFEKAQALVELNLAEGDIEKIRAIGIRI